MPYRFIDSITKIDGQKAFAQWRTPVDSKYQQCNGLVLSSIISEAVGQLASWKTLHDNNFTFRPVFLFADRIQFKSPATPESLINLECEIHKSEQDNISFSGRATLDCREILFVENCTGYLLNLGELEDPAWSRKLFQTLLHSTDKQAWSQSEIKLTDEIEIPEVIQRSETEIHLRALFSKDLSFYNDHFPRFPVTPVAVMHEVVNMACKEMLNPTHNSKMIVTESEITSVKIKHFLKPDTPFTVNARVREKMQIQDCEEKVKIFVDVACGDQFILRGTYTYLICKTRVEKAYA